MKGRIPIQIKSSTPSTKVRTDREATAHATKERLLDCALTLFSERGYDATSVRDIIHLAGVTQPTFYYHCHDKQDLFLQLVRSHYEASLLCMKELIKDNEGCERRLRAIAVTSFAMSVADVRVPRLMFQTAFGPPIAGISQTMDDLGDQRFGLIRKVIREGAKSGEVISVSVDGLALSFCCLLDQHINLLARKSNPGTYLTKKLADWIVTVFLEGAKHRS